MLENQFQIDDLKRSEAAKFIAEVFYGELKFILDRELDDILMVRKQGLNGSFTLEVTTKYVNVSESYKEFLILHLNQNGIYHQLPEILFHPLVISSPTMSNREVVDAIRENRKLAKRNAEFFLPFDTEFFKERVKIVNRHLNFLSNNESKQNLFRTAKRILDVDLDISQQNIYKLFLNLCNAEFFKENFKEIEKLVDVVLGLDIKLKYKDKYFEDLPYLSVGNAQLGINLGLVGRTKSEVEDVHATIILPEPFNNFNKLLKNIDSLKTVLQFFITANREIFITYEVKNQAGFSLGNRYLGYDTYA